MSGKWLHSISKKELVAATGIVWLGFLAGHLLGNTSIWFGGKFFDGYAEHLHGLGIILYALEIGLASFLSIHIVTALWVTVENFFARPVGYVAGRKSKAGWVSKFMPYTGLYMLVFIILHLVNFRIKRGTATDSFMASNLFESPAWMIYYTVSMAVVALHVTHGFWSSFQTLGLSMDGRRNHDLVRKFSLIFSIAVGLGFGLIPLGVYFLPGLIG